MFGDIVDTLVAVLRESDIVTSEKMAVCVIAKDETQTVNTTLPAIAIGFEDSMGADVFIGGAVKDRLRIKICVMTNLTNYSWSGDKGLQAKILSYGHRVRNAVEMAKGAGKFDELKAKYNLWPLYKGFKSYQRIAITKDFQTEVSVAEIVYETTVFDLGLYAEQHPTAQVDKGVIRGYSGTEQDQETKIPIEETPPPTPPPSDSRNYTCIIEIRDTDNTVSQRVQEVSVAYTDASGTARTVSAQKTNPCSLELIAIDYKSQNPVCTITTTGGTIEKKLYIPAGKVDDSNEFFIVTWKSL